jgi:hypothetical protein
MRKTIADTLPLNEGAFDDDDRRKDTSRSPTLGRRASRRQRVMLSALIVDISSDAVVSCRIENVSDQGARIKLAERRFLPATFWLIAVTSGIAYDAKTKWREDDRLGVEIGEPIDLSDPTDSTGRRLHKIWTVWR